MACAGLEYAPLAQQIEFSTQVYVNSLAAKVRLDWAPSPWGLRWPRETLSLDGIPHTIEKRAIGRSAVASHAIETHIAC